MHISFSFVIYVMLRVTLKCTCHRSTYRDCHGTQVCYLRLYFTTKTSLLSSVTMDDKNRHTVDGKNRSTFSKIKSPKNYYGLCCQMEFV